MMSVFVTAFSQEVSRKAAREKSRIEKQQQIDSLIHSKVFVFSATRALPLGGNSIDLTTNPNSVKFHPDEIESYMPFFGRAYSAEYGGDGGIKFKAKPTEFNIVTMKGGKGFEINATVAVTRDYYKLTLHVSPEGSATLTINSNQKSAISYFGNIMKPVEVKEN